MTEAGGWEDAQLGRTPTAGTRTDTGRVQIKELPSKWHSNFQSTRQASGFQRRNLQTSSGNGMGGARRAI